MNRRQYFWEPKLDADYDAAEDGRKPITTEEDAYGVIVPWQTDPATANLIGSLIEGQTLGAEGAWHLPVLDLDKDEPEEMRDQISAWLGARIQWPTIDAKPSRTAGHWHVYLNWPLPWARYKNLLQYLVIGGVLEAAWYKVSVKQGATFVRVPVAK